MRAKRNWLLKKSIIELHIKSVKHGRGKVKLNSKEKRERDLAKSLNAYDEEVHPVGESLPTDQRVFRIKVVTTFLKAGVPLKFHCLNHHEVEENDGHADHHIHLKAGKL